MVLFEIIIVSLLSESVSQKTCATMSSFKEVITGNYLANVTFDVRDDVGLAECLKQCQRRSRCKSINYVETTSTCELNYISGKLNLSRRNDSVYTDIIDWSTEFAGVCSNHACPLNSTCSDVNNQPVCNVTFCGVSSSLFDAPFDLPSNHDGFFKEGDELKLTCPTGYYSDDPVCGSKGIWVGNGTCKPPPLDCDAVKDCNPSAQAGNYWILPTIAGVKAVMVFCVFDNYATAYISLNKTNNFSVYPGINSCHSSAKFCGKTTYSKYKLRIDNIFRFASLVHGFAENDCDGTFARIGFAGGCLASDGFDCRKVKHYFKINMTGTGFIVDPTVNWTVPAWRSENNRVIEGMCSCADECKPIFPTRSSHLPVVVDPEYHPPESAGTVLDCDRIIF